MGDMNIYDDVDRDARDDHRHDPPADWNEYELGARRSVFGGGLSHDRQVLIAIEADADRQAGCYDDREF